MTEATPTAQPSKLPTKTRPIVFRVKKKSEEMVQSLTDLIHDATAVLKTLESRQLHQKFSISFVIDDTLIGAENTHQVGPGGCHSHFHFDCNNGD